METVKPVRIAAIVVTYNRKALLGECLDALLNQTRPADSIIVLDNASTDGTGKLFEKDEKYDLSCIDYIRMDSNLGGAGGFCEGIKYACRKDFDWIWVMDDDTIPEPESLEKLCDSVSVLPENTSFVASSVYGPGKEAMNLPIIDMRKVKETGYADWYRYLDKGLVKIERATFVSILVKNGAVKKVGLPFKNYFIWGDDSEYTLRLTRYYGPAYFSGDSRVLHKRAIVKDIDIQEETNPGRLNLYVYFYRNTLVNKREYEGTKEAWKTIYRDLKKCIRILKDKNCTHKFKKIVIIHKGIWGYVFGTYGRKEFKNRMKCLRPDD